MKTYLKNTAFCLLTIGLLLMTWGLLELGKAVIQAQLGVSDSGLSLAVLIIAAGGGAVKTFRDWKRKQREDEIISALLADAIRKQREKLAVIDAEGPSAGKARRRAVCNITLIALEEKRDRLIQGKRTGAQK